MEGVAKRLSKAYYSVEGYWKGYSAVSKLAAATGVDTAIVKEWLSKQAMWQIYLPPPKHIPRPHWNISAPNAIHQADLLFLPHDTIGRKTYKYALVVVDVASRYTDAEPLTSKYSTEVAKALTKIYSRRMKWPKTIMVDSGTEFMGAVSQAMKGRSIKVQRGEAGNHKSQSLVERANRTISEKLFSHQYAQEMLTDGRSREWVRNLPGVVASMNNGVRRITGKKPQFLIKQDHIDHFHPKYDRPVGLNEERLPGYVKVRYLYAPGEEEGGERRRATDPIWSLETYDLSRTQVSKNQPVLYFLAPPAPRRSFVQEELQVVPEDTESPPSNNQ
jgi:hypothetical protein